VGGWVRHCVWVGFRLRVLMQLLGGEGTWLLPCMILAPPFSLGVVCLPG
jgi:hypothetical protein